MLKVRLIAFFACFFAGSVAHAQRVVASGGTIQIGNFGAFDPACHSLGTPTINLLQQPSGGTIFLRASRGYPNFSTYNTRSRCNTQKLPMTTVSYKATPGFTGYDTVALEAIYPPNGLVRRYRYQIEVR